MASLDLTVNATSFQGHFLILKGGREKDSVKRLRPTMNFDAQVLQNKKIFPSVVVSKSERVMHLWDVPEIYGNENVYY